MVWMIRNHALFWANFIKYVLVPTYHCLLSLLLGVNAIAEVILHKDIKYLKKVISNCTKPGDKIPHWDQPPHNQLCSCLLGKLLFLSALLHVFYWDL